MAIWNKESQSQLTRAAAGGGTVPKAPPRRFQRSAITENIVSRASGVVAQYVTQSVARQKSLEDAQAVSSGMLSYRQAIGYDLPKEMSKFYRTNGTFIAPEKGYRRDFGWGVSLAYEDFFEKEGGKRRSMMQIFKDKSANFIKGRKGQAPSREAHSRLEMGLRELELKQMLLTDGLQENWHIKSVSNAANAVVRSYKEQISTQRGFDPSTFSLHLKSMADILGPAAQYADAGALQNTFRLGVTDLISAGVAEAGNSKDNNFSLAVLGHSPLRQSNVVQQSIAGLSQADQKFFHRVVAQHSQGRKLYQYGSPIPQEVNQHLDWALSQVSSENLDKIQRRAIRSFESQTEIARGNIRARIKGLFEAVGSPDIQETGFREQVKKSIQRGLVDVNNIYPASLYPQENAQYSAAFLAGHEMVEMRDTFNTTPTSLLPAMATQSAMAVGARIREQLGPENLFISQNAVTTASKALQNLATTIRKRRESDPLMALSAENKSIKGLLARLDKPYSSTARLAEDQDALKRMVERDALKKGVGVSFLTGLEKDTITSFLARGQRYQALQTMEALRTKYGDGIYFDYLAPEIATLPKALGGGQALGLFRNAGIASYFVQAKESYRDNIKVLKGQDKGDAATIESTSLQDYDDWEIVTETIEGRLGVNQNSDAAIHDLGLMVREFAAHRYVNGMDDPEDALENSLEFLKKGLGGSEISFEGRDFLAPPAMDVLSNLQVARLEDVVRNPNFLRERVFNRLTPNSHYLNTSQETGNSLQQLYERDFEDDVMVNWAFTEEGIRPMFLVPDIGVRGPFEDAQTPGKPFTILYTDLAPIISEPRYN